LLSAPVEDREALWVAALGLRARRTAYDYMTVASHWAVVQHAASIRQALDLIRKPRRLRVGPFLWPDLDGFEVRDWPTIFEASRIWSIDYVTLGGERKTVDR
jgi:hypothetical protein